MTIPQTWGDAITSYLAAQRVAGHRPTTVNSRRQHLEHLARRVKVGPWELTPDQLTDYAGAQEWARETRRSRRNTFVSFYEWAVFTERTSNDPTSALVKVKPGAPNPRPVPDDVYVAALFRADPVEAIWVDLAAEHGLRRAEIACVHSRDIVKTLVGYDLVVHGKGGKERLVPLTPSMARALLDRGEGFLFPGDHGGHVSARWLGKRVNRLLDGDWTIHKLRHRAATRFWLASEGDAYGVANLMGWSNLNMVPVYVAQPSDRLRSIVERASRKTINRLSTAG